MEILCQLTFSGEENNVKKLRQFLLPIHQPVLNTCSHNSDEKWVKCGKFSHSYADKDALIKCHN